jgi:predicted nucleotidyltransferase
MMKGRLSFDPANGGVKERLGKQFKETGLNEVFLREQVIFAYLFGSQASGNIGKLSDVDIAVYFDECISKFAMFNSKLKIMGEFSLVFKRDDIDVVILNDAYPLLEHRIIKQAKLIFSVNEKKRIDYELRAVMRYLDFKPYIEKHTRETIYGR